MPALYDMNGRSLALARPILLPVFNLGHDQQLVVVQQQQHTGETYLHHGINSNFLPHQQYFMHQQPSQFGSSYLLPQAPPPSAMQGSSLSNDAFNRNSYPTRVIYANQH